MQQPHIINHCYLFFKTYLKLIGVRVLIFNNVVIFCSFREMRRGGEGRERDIFSEKGESNFFLKINGFNLCPSQYVI